MICGTRGDAQPFVALGLELKVNKHWFHTKIRSCPQVYNPFPADTGIHNPQVFDWP